MLRLEWDSCVKLQAVNGLEDIETMSSGRDSDVTKGLEVQMDENVSGNAVLWHAGSAAAVVGVGD